MNDLERDAHIIEQPFDSAVPVVGSIIVRFRTLWNDMASRWYVQKLFQQQNRFNARVAREFFLRDERFLAQQAESAAQEKRLLAQLIAQDRELVSLTHTVAELELQIKRLSRQLEEAKQE